ACWSDVWPRPLLSENVTDSLRCRLSFEDECDPSEEKCLDLYRQRPCSTQLTGIVVLLRAATSTEVFSTRFCLAPRSSSPSRNRTRESPVLFTSKFGTEPPSLTSSTVPAPVRRPSAERR